jgi:hypothetical protein
MAEEEGVCVAAIEVLADNQAVVVKSKRIRLGRARDVDGRKCVLGLSISDEAHAQGQNHKSFPNAFHRDPPYESASCLYSGVAMKP